MYKTELQHLNNLKYMKKTLFLIALSSAMAMAETQTNVTAILYGNCDLHGKEGGYTVKLYEGEYSEGATPDKTAPAVGAESSPHHQYHYTLSLWGGDVDNLTVIIKGDAPSAEVLDTSNTEVTKDTNNSTQICNDVYAGAGNRNTGSNENAWVVRGDAHIIMEGGFVDGALSGAGRIGETKGSVTIDMKGGYARYGIRGAGGNNVEENVGGNVVEDVTINMSGGMIGLKKGSRASITGAGYGSRPNDATASVDGSAKNTYINITGGIIYRTDISGGGIGSVVHGKAEVLFDATKNAIDVQHSEVTAQGLEYWGDNSANDGTIKGDSSITFIGDKLAYSGYISGDVNERVTGTDSLHFGNEQSAFDGTISAGIRNFSEMTIGEKSRLSLKSGSSRYKGGVYWSSDDQTTDLYHRIEKVGELVMKADSTLVFEGDADGNPENGMHYVDSLKMENGSVIQICGACTPMYAVRESSISGTICGAGIWDDVVIRGAGRTRGNSAPTVYVGNMDGSTTTMTWDSIAVHDASVAFRVNTLADYSKVVLKYDPYYATTSPHYTTGNAITLSNTSLLLDFSAQFNQSELKPGVSFTLFNIEQGVAFGGENGEFSTSLLPKLPKGMAWDVSRLYTDGILSICGEIIEPLVPQQVAIAANWGVFKSTQAFMGTLKGPRSGVNCVKLGKKGIEHRQHTLAWSSVYAHDSRIGGNGADYSVYGGAVGVERELKKNRAVGVAFGYDWGKVNPFNSGKVEQETAHLALYGRAAAWCMKNNSSMTIDWAAAYGCTDSEYEDYDGTWTQDSLQLEARATYTRRFNDRTTGSAFVGAEYFAMDSDSIGNVRVGTLQNLRMQLGTGISYKATNRTSVFGEAALHYDAMRHNPYVEANGERLRNGANPGRFGGNIAVGVDYQLNNDWSLRGSYSFEASSDNSEHNVNVGAVYSF